MLNSKYFVPQNRERIFIIGYLRREPRPEVFPISEECEIDARACGKAQENGTWIRRKVSGAVDANYAKGGGSRTMIKMIQNSSADSYRIYSPEGIARTLRANSGGLGSKTGVYAITEKRTEHAKQVRKEMGKEGKDWSARRDKELSARDDELANCLTSAQSNERFLYDNTRYRQLTPLECERLQGFPDGWTEGISDTQRYKCLGNAITVPVVQYIAKHLK